MKSAIVQYFGDTVLCLKAIRDRCCLSTPIVRHTVRVSYLRCASMKKILIELKVKTSFRELGKYTNSFGARSDLGAFEEAVKAGLTNEQLLVLFPVICTRYPGYVNNHLIKAGRIGLELPRICARSKKQIPSLKK